MTQQKQCIQIEKSSWWSWKIGHDHLHRSSSTVGNTLFWEREWPSKLSLTFFILYQGSSNGSFGKIKWMTKFCNCKWIPFVYSQWLLKILNNTYQFWPVEKCWFWWGKTKLLIVSKLFTVNKKKVSKAWVGTSLSPPSFNFLTHRRNQKVSSQPFI